MSRDGREFGRWNGEEFKNISSDDLGLETEEELGIELPFKRLIVC